MVKEMRYYIFGMDGERPVECAKELKERGFSAVVSPPGERAAEEAKEAGLEIWGCIGAFSMHEDDPEEWLAEDAFGERRRWFGSGCPNENALWDRGLSAIEKWKKWGAKGIFADGARFASPCPGTELFASCFCPRCMELGKKLGYDMNGMRRRVRLYTKMPDLLPPADWLRFREECTGRWFSAFSERVRSAGMISASFIFTPGLSGLVGQTPEAARELHLVAPMLYRRYRPKPGIATLNDEFAALHRLYAGRGDAAAAQTILAHTGVQTKFDNADDIWQNGFEPGIIGSETARAKRMYNAPVAPILQLDDERLDESIRCAKQAGADAIGFFAYSEEGMRHLPDLNETER